MMRPIHFASKIKIATDRYCMHEIVLSRKALTSSNIPALLGRFLLVVNSYENQEYALPTSFEYLQTPLEKRVYKALAITNSSDQQDIHY